MKVQSGWQHSRKIRSKHLFTQEQTVFFFSTNKSFRTSSWPTTKVSLCDERGQSIILLLNFGRGASKTSNRAESTQPKQVPNKQKGLLSSEHYRRIPCDKLTVIRNVHIYARLLKSSNENVASSIKVGTKQTMETNRKTPGRI